MVTPQTTLATDTNSMEQSGNHKLSTNWTMWAHLPHDTDWTILSYKNIFTMKTIEESIAISETMPDVLVKNCMLFLMKEGVKPIWEDPQNRSGGCFSYKINNKNVVSIWKNLSYSLVGESLTEQNSARPAINGITISPKKNFCIVKIWFSNCNHQNPSIIIDDIGISSQGCLFKTHISA